MSRNNIPYGYDELYAMGAHRRFSGKNAAEVAFPLGGIGTGTVSLGGRGELRDWEIFNRPNKGARLPWTFFSIRAATVGTDKPQFRVLEAPLQPPYNAGYNGQYDGSGFGPPRDSAPGIPRMQWADFTGEYPFARIEFFDAELPVDVCLEAWNPMIPHNADDSGIPVAIFSWTITNPGDEPVDVTLLGNLPANANGELGEVTVRREKGLTSLQVDLCKEKPQEPGHGSMALSTTWPETTYQTCRDGGEWFSSLRNFVEQVLHSGRLLDDDSPASGETEQYVGSLGMVARVEPGATITLPMFLTWSFPSFQKYWHECACKECDTKPTWRNYYAAAFPDAWAAAQYVSTNLDRLERETRLFHDVLFDSTLPTVVTDAISSQMSIIRSTTCIRLPDGTFYGFEGCHGSGGCCEGSCTHVWNYALTHAFLYPDLERSMREAEYKFSMFPDGKVCFRAQLPLGVPPTDFHACADGQMGAIMQVYRDWQLGAGDDWLAEIWPLTKKSMEYAWVQWDADRDGLMEGIQHNTYDTELHGPNAMCGIPYLGALRSAALMADHMGEPEFAEECRRIEENGSKHLDRLLFDGEYYIQPYDPASGLKYQVGDGCLVDQVFGQLQATAYGLGYVLPEEHIRSAIESVYRYNFKVGLWDHFNFSRVFTINDEAGTLICTWPKGGRPETSIVYADETMIGFEYQLAAHLVYEGMTDEGLVVLKAVRDRHDGERRNPWNEFECGNHYARSMANWGVKLALDGFTFNASERRLGFAPKVNREQFRTFWATATGWGRYSQSLCESTYTLEVLAGSQVIQRLDLADLPDAEVTVNGSAGTLASRKDGNSVVLDAPIELREGGRLTISRA
jgi:non-lysosomal glucosylceramidase